MHAPSELLDSFIRPAVDDFSADVIERGESRRLAPMKHRDGRL